jgi:hypothetical protein
MNAKGLDFLGRRAWMAQVKPSGLPSAQAISDDLPSIVLPITNNEPAIVGKAADSHRRGRGLPFPTEAQIPVFGDLRNEAGRVLVAATFECIARAETEWGQLSDTKIGWRPYGEQWVQLDAARAIAQAVEHETHDADSIGLVVPDSIGVAGQHAILGAIRNRKIILVPRSVASALPWCRECGLWLDLKHKLDQAVGHVVVCDVALGRWSISKLPIFWVMGPDGPQLVPAHFPAYKRTALGTSGLGVITGQSVANYEDFLRPRFSEPWLTGQRHLKMIGSSQREKRKPLFNSLTALEGSGLEEGLEDIRRLFHSLKCPADWQRCAGVIVTGALAEAKAEAQSIAYWLARRLELPLLASDEQSAAKGAALAASGLDTNRPTWLEMVDQLDLYYIGKNSLGDLEPAWRQILPQKLVKAGTEYRNEEPITGLKLQAGSNSVQITIRRPGEDGSWLYRKVDSTPGKTSESDIPLLINVVARPGQGFALVKVQSKEAGIFESQLDWQKMVQRDEPKRPTLGYIPSAVELVPDLRLWNQTQPDLLILLFRLNTMAEPGSIEQAARVATRRIVRSVPIVEVEPETAYRSPSQNTDLFRYTRALGRSGESPTPDGDKILSELRSAGLTWLLAHQRRPSGGARWLIKHFGWHHLGCPRQLVEPIMTRIEDTPESCSGDDLHLAGLTLSESEDIEKFFAAYLAALPGSKTPNAWLKAFRNIIKFNEHALAETEPIVIQCLYEATLERLEWAVDQERPLIAQNCLEALLFSLKRRRYDDSFALSGSKLYVQTTRFIAAWDTSGRMRYRTKLIEVRNTFARFLRTEGDLQDLATLLEDEDESADD